MQRKYTVEATYGAQVKKAQETAVMIATKIAPNEAGQRFDKYLKKLLKNAPDSFIYKMLRKKNIVLNGKKADGKEKLCLDDEVFE